MTKPLVLIVEDNLLVAGEIQHALEAAGYRVIGPARDYDRAMQLVRAFHPDIVLLDIELSGPQNGVAIARELLKLHIPALFVSAGSPLDSDAKNSAVGLLTKPVEAGRLIDAVKLVQEVAAGKTPSDPPLGFERYDWRPNGNGKNA
jgi:DNA-binding response OmpR family regulator